MRIFRKREIKAKLQKRLMHLMLSLCPRIDESNTPIARTVLHMK